MAPAFSNVGPACCRDLMARYGRRSRCLPSLLLIVLALTGSGASSSADGGNTTDFTTVIQPLFESKCWSCHGQNSRKGDLDLRTPAEILKGGESGAVIVPGKPDESLLYKKVFEREMPPKKKNQPLTDLEVESIRKWIQSGASFGTELASTKPAITQHRRAAHPSAPLRRFATAPANKRAASTCERAPA